MGLGDFLSGILGTNSQIGVGPQQSLTNQNFTPTYNEGLGGYRNANAGQMALAQQLQQNAAGKGPNPAVDMLRAAQDQTAAQAMGVYANNRAVNPALAARQASMVSSDANQHAANQAATLTAQQQLNAQGQLGSLYGQMGNQGLGLYGTAQQANAAQNNAFNQANQINAGVAGGNQQASQAIVGGLLGAGGSAMGGAGGAAPAAVAAAHGGIIPKMSDGGMAGAGPQSFVGKFMSGFGNSAPTVMGGQGSSSQALSSGVSSFGTGLGKQIAGSPNTMSNGGGVGEKLKSGGKVPGSAKVSGDSLKNDTVPAMLSPGEAVIPRSIMQSADAPKRAAAFVAAILARQNMGKKK